MKNNFEVAKIIVNELNRKGAKLGNASYYVVEEILNHSKDLCFFDCPNCSKGKVYKTGTGYSCDKCDYSEEVIP